ELPASVVSELELAGIPIERRYEGGSDSPRRPGVSLNPKLDPERAALDAASAAAVQPTAQPRTIPRKQWTTRSGLPNRLAARFAGARLSLPSGWRSRELRPT